MENGPQASHLVLLRQLPTLAPGIKVRFLGCVDDYDGNTAVLTLKDRFSTSGKTVAALVGISNITSTLDITLTQVGAWINVVGYLKGSSTNTNTPPPPVKGQSPATSVDLDAVMIWSAGAVKLEDYEAGVKAMQSTTGR